jgi:FkbM family methyltransferase
MIIDNLSNIIKWVSPNLHHNLKLFYYKHKILPKEFLIHVSKLTKNHTVIDLGANVGLVSEVMARTNARVISFEPNLKAFSSLELIKKKYSNMHIHNTAAGTKKSIVKLFHHKDVKSSNNDFTQSSSLLNYKSNVSTEFYEEVEEIDFAAFIKSLNSEIEILKIDIEGYEIDLINHLLDQNVFGSVNKVYVETHTKKNKSLVNPTNNLKSRIKSEGLEDKFFFDWH